MSYASPFLVVVHLGASFPLLITCLGIRNQQLHTHTHQFNTNSQNRCVAMTPQDVINSSPAICLGNISPLRPPHVFFCLQVWSIIPEAHYSSSSPSKRYLLQMTPRHQCATLRDRIITAFRAQSEEKLFILSKEKKAVRPSAAVATAAVATAAAPPAERP